MVVHGKLKTKENFKLLALKVVAVAYESWSLTRGSKYSDLRGNLLVFWKTGRWRFDCSFFKQDNIKSINLKERLADGMHKNWKHKHTIVCRVTIGSDVNPLFL